MAATADVVAMEEGETATQETTQESASGPSVEQLETELMRLSKRWYEVGQKMGLRSSQLHSIETEKGRDASYYFREMLSLLAGEGSEGGVTWESVVKAVREFGETELARQLAEKYGVEKVEEEEEEEEEGEVEKKVPDLKIQKEEIRALLNKKLEKGDTWYLIDVRWMKQWKKYTGYETWDQSYSGQQSYFPGPLDTENLFAGKGAESDALKEHLMEELDYSLVPEAAWNKLVTWYGVSETSRPIARTVVEYGLYMKHCKVEVYLLSFKLSLHPKLSETTTKPFSRADTVADLEKVIRHTFSVEEKTVCRVWHRYMSHTYELLSDSTQTLQDAGLYNMQTIVLECQKEDGTWPRATSQTPYSATHSTRSQDSITGSSYSSQSTSSNRSGGGGSYWSGSYAQQPSHPGLCGLSNLGNTCFMNSAIQCLSNTEPLTEYFTGGAYKKHINKKNPLGMQGQVAETYGALLDDMWSGKCSTCSPRQFKTVVGRFAPQFSGYQQQDSHELLAFLLDGLHEDLNLVLKKPYVDMSVKTEDREEKDIADESWYKYLQRNQSVVVKVFQGQLKSTLVCPDCSMLSKTFDPFMYLSLPLPVKKTRKMEVVVVFADPNKPLIKYSLIVPKRGTISDLKEELSEQTEIAADMMVVVDVYNSRFHRVYDNKENVSHILDRDDIYIYELSHQVGDKEWVHVPVYHRELVVKKVNYGYSYSQRYHNLFGLPTIIRVPRNISTYDTVHQAVLNRCSRYVCSSEEAQRRLAESEKEKEDEKKEDMDGEEEEEEDGEREEGKEEDGEREEGKEEEEKEEKGDEKEEGEGQEKGEGKEGKEGGKEGDEPMDEGENEAQNMNNSENGEEDDNQTGTGKQSPSNSQKKKKKKTSVEFQMFKLMVVNSYGTQDIKELPSDGSPLRLTNQTYIACDWGTEVKDKCYNLDAALEKEDRSQADVPEPPKEITLNNCLDLFTEKERLGKDDEWYCPECKEMVRATKKFDLWKLPRVLVIHLKRFSYNRYWRDKLDTLIEFPIKGLDLRRYVTAPDQPESVYDLFGVSNHFGGMGGGHYTAYCKNKSTGKWYNYDDSHVSEASEDRIVSSSAYLLFYCRRDEGKVVHPPLSRTLSQTFREEVKQRKKRYNPSETSHDEETMEQDEEGAESGEPHPPNNNNNIEDDAFNPSSSSSMNEPD